MISKEDLTRIAIITKTERYTYGELFENICIYSEIYRAKKYSKVAIYGENSSQWAFAFFSAWQNDCIPVPIDYMASVDDVAYMLNDCKPELVFVSPSMKENLERVKEQLSYQPEILFFGETELPAYDPNNQWRDPEDDDKIAIIIYTSGTTGNPKGVMLSFFNIKANIDAVSKDVEIFNADRQVLILLPLHHVLPLVGSLVCPLTVGSSVVFAPSMQSSELMETLKNNQVAIIIGVPRLYELIYKGIKAKIDSNVIARLLFMIVRWTKNPALAKKVFAKVHEGLGGHLRYLVSGGAALNREVGSFFTTLGFEILEGFGMTEASPMITFPRPGKVVLGTTGQALPGLQVEIRDGEIVAKGPSIMKGYYNRPEETAEVLRDGWLYTGDLGYLDEKGYLRITGRKKEIIILPNGKNVNPVELEQKIEKVSACVSEVGVFLHNNALHAVILPDLKVLSALKVENPELYFRENVLSIYNKEASSYKRVMHFTLIKEVLPRTRLGKIQHYKLESLLHATSKEKAKLSEQPDTEEYKAVKSFIESLVDTDISPDDHLEFDIALDSLGKLSLIDFIERAFGVKIEEENLFKFPSVKAMVEHIREKKKWFNTDQVNWSETLKSKVSVKLPTSWPTQNLIRILSRGVLMLGFRIHRKGIENIPEGPCIFAPNHQSFLDAFLFTAYLKRKALKNTYFYAKKKHVNNWALRFLASKNNVIVMDLDNNLMESIQKLAEVLKQGKKIVIFPEGTRTKSGELGEFKKTFAILSTELNIPVIPVSIKGAYKALPSGAFIPRPFTKIEVNFLSPIYPQNYTADSLVVAVQQSVQQSLYE